jgi:two-component system, OmpR family, phosphate regulon response regulator PhoB
MHPGSAPNIKLILVVEDDFATRDVLTFFLKSHGHKTMEAANRDEALTVIAHDLPDIILLDYYMDGLSAVAFLKLIQDHDDAVPKVFLMSAAWDSKEIADSLGLELIKKPFDPERLLKLIA